MQIKDHILVSKRNPELQADRDTRQDDNTLHKNCQTSERTTFVQLADGDHRGAQSAAHLPTQEDVVAARLQTGREPVRAARRPHVRHERQQTQNARHAHELQAALHTVPRAVPHRPHPH